MADQGPTEASGQGDGKGEGEKGPEIRIVRHATPTQHVVVWLAGVIIASLLPLMVLYFHGIDTSSPPGMDELLSHGDLLIISLVFTIAGLAELVLVANRIRQEQLLPAALLLIGGVLLIATEALWYADLTARVLGGEKVTSTHAIAYGSLTFFALSGFCSSACVRLAAGAR